MKKTISICLAVLMVFLLSAPAYAADAKSLEAESVVSPQYTHILLLIAGLGIDSAGKADCVGSVDSSSTSYKTSLTVSLQKYANSKWSTIKSWSDSGPGRGLIVENYYYVGSGRYRVCSTAKVYNSSGTLLETASFYSQERTY
ncbi:MAG: hypothetical protein Q8876_04530 [Bacillota bacterium]|nr:hypothetical protein [Bacillota bacterium]